MTVPAPEPLKLGRARRKCSYCKQHGHDVRQCPERPADPVECTAPEQREPGGPDELIDECARLREEIDGLELETAQYDRVRAELETRIAANKARAIVAKAELAILRARRPR